MTQTIYTTEQLQKMANEYASAAAARHDRKRRGNARFGISVHASGCSLQVQAKCTDGADVCTTVAL